MADEKAEGKIIMKKTIIFYLAIVFLLGMFLQTSAMASKSETGEMQVQEIKITLAGTAETRADYFAGKSGHSVILAPGAMFSKESWHFLAARLQDQSIGSVALNSGAKPDLNNALAFLKTKGSKKITLIGASAGGAGVLYALQGNIDPLVDSVILLAPAGGLPIRDNRVKKLFIVAEDDMISSSAEVYKLYRDSSEPKIYKEIPGSSEHAQRLFNGIHQEEIIQLIINFIKN